MTQKSKTGGGKRYKGLCSLCRTGKLWRAVDKYLESCCLSDGESDKKSRTHERFPNLAGLCRYTSSGISELSRLKEEYPEEYDRLLAVFEDEALCACGSATLMSAYMKKRLLYSEEKTTQTDTLEVSYSFEHDIYADGE